MKTAFEQEQAERVNAAGYGYATDDTPSAFQGFMRDIAIETRAFVERKIAEATTPLQARIKELEARPIGGVHYAGIYEPKKGYVAGSLVSKRGLWLALNTIEPESGTGGAATWRPGPGSSAHWKLILKQGDA